VSEGLQSAEITQEIVRLEGLAQEWVRLFPQAVPQAERWHKVLAQVQSHLTEEVVRVAVVGTVKSGKSTVINALVGRDILKRGAGILTAMITRVQPGPDMQALLQFKTWPEIAEEINRAMGLLPDDRLLKRSTLDIQQSADRELLARILARGQEEDLWSKGSLSQNYSLLKAYLEGYDLLKDYLSKGHELALAGAALARHRELVTQEACAVYLKDVLLTLPTPWLPGHTELGDCQGSDSPVPQHLTQVLAYLLKTDLVLYVISSRVGLRKADFQFLTELKRMGLGDHLLFLLNVDLTEHRELADLEQLRMRVKEELSPWLPDLRLAAFSALKTLLDRRLGQGEALEPRETALVQVWAADRETMAYVDQEFQQFSQGLGEELRQLQGQRLMGGSLSQVQMAARGMREQAELAQSLLHQDLGAFQEMEVRLRERRQPLVATKNILKEALNGSEARLKAALKGRVSSYLDVHLGKGDSLLQFIAKYQPDWEQLVPAGSQEPFKLLLYRLFQDFQQELSRFAAGEFNLQALEFIRVQENWVKGELQKTITPLFVTLQEALTLYYREMETLGLPGLPPQIKPQVSGFSKKIEVPLLSLPLELDWRWAGQVWMRSGVGVLRRAWQALNRKLGREVEGDPRAHLLQDLDKALKTIKAWLLEQVRVSLIDYSERLKFRYFFPAVEEAVRCLEADLDTLIGTLTADLEGLAASLGQEEAGREAKQKGLRELAAEVGEIEERLTGAAGRSAESG
jgi:hypothetical protein